MGWKINKKLAALATSAIAYNLLFSMPITSNTLKNENWR